MGLSAKNKEILFNPLSKDNPVIVQMLGICSALAVTVKLQPALVMAISVTAVVAFANVIISLLRKTIPNRIRIIIQLVVVAALVTIVNEILKAFAYDVSKQLSGSGTLLGFRIIPQAVYDAGYVNNGLMIMPPMALILCAVIVWIHRARNKDLQEK